MAVQVVVVYSPKPGGEVTLEREVEAHAPTLRRLGLATEAASLALRAADGSIVECFEWASREAMSQAHEHPDVQAMWGRFEACSSYVPLAALPNAAELFAEFELLGRY